MRVRSIGVLYTSDYIKVPAGSVGRYLSADTNNYNTEYVRVQFEQGTVRCTKSRIEKV
jgi:hypothetical protein